LFHFPFPFQMVLLNLLVDAKTKEMKWEQKNSEHLSVITIQVNNSKVDLENIPKGDTKRNPHMFGEDVMDMDTHLTEKACTGNALFSILWWSNDENFEVYNPVTKEWVLVSAKLDLKQEPSNFLIAQLNSIELAIIEYIDTMTEEKLFKP
jgi:hypothetical protein